MAEWLPGMLPPDAGRLERLDEKTISRFWSKVDRRGPDECWLWLAGTFRDGYGCFKLGGRNGRSVGAHRIAYEMSVGPIASGLFVCHRCDVPGCCNPAHLWLGTPSDNIADKVSKGRSHRLPGELHSMAKLTDLEVIRMRELRSDGWGVRRLASAFGIGKSQAWRIVRGASWRHLAPAHDPAVTPKVRRQR